MKKNKFMQIAYKEAKNMLGVVCPNPAVGCVIEKQGKIISKGHTNIGGRPHAETDAINKINDKNKLLNSNFYITLEPCVHYGKTPPCINEILKTKPKNIFIGIKDPDNRVYNKSFEIFKKNNISVDYGIMKDQIIDTNIGYIYTRMYQRPYITVKIACSLDNKIATSTDESKWITSEKSRVIVQKIRKENDAILTGSNTIMKDNPNLNYRLKNKIDYSPIKIIISNKKTQGNLLHNNLNIFKNKPTWLITSNDNYIKNTNFEKIIKCNYINDNNDLDIKEALKKAYLLGGITSILVEAGSYTITKLLEQDLVDQLIIFRAPIIIGKDGKDAIQNLNFKRLKECTKMILVKCQKIGDDILEIYQSNSSYNNVLYFNKIL